MTVMVGEKKMPTLDIEGKYENITFEINDISIATVNTNNGEIIGISPGTAVLVVTITDYNGEQSQKSCNITVEWPTYANGSIINIKGHDFYVVADSGETVTLLYKTTIGKASWPNAKVLANNLGKNLGGSGRLMSMAEANGMAANYRKNDTNYWLIDTYDSRTAYDVRADRKYWYCNI